jgi:hypothetical protein
MITDRQKTIPGEQNSAVPRVDPHTATARAASPAGAR